jgi:hypothetical protein
VPAGTADSHSPECVIPDVVLIQFGPPDDAHLLLETCRAIRNKYIKKECIKLVITQNRIKLHGQQNIKIILPIFPDATYVLMDVKQYFTCLLFGLKIQSFTLDNTIASHIKAWSLHLPPNC